MGALRFGTVAVLGSAVNWIGFLFILTGTPFVGYFIVNAMHSDISPLVPCLTYSMVGYVVAQLYMNVFGLSVDTSLQCFLATEEMGGSKDFVPDELNNFVNDTVGTKEDKQEEPTRAWA